MAHIVEEVLIVRFSQVIRNDATKAKKVVSDEHVTTLDVTLQEVLDLPAGVVVEVERDPE